MFRDRRIKICILVTSLFLAAAAAGCLYLKEAYTVQTVYVEGNIHYSEEEIKAIVMDGALGDNSLYLYFKYKNKGVEGIPFVDVMDVEILAPDTIRIVVYEKALTGCIKYMDSYVYFDKDGCVVECSSVRTVGVPQVTGLSFGRIAIGEPIDVETPEVFSNVLEITKLLKKYGLTSDKIYFNKAGEITIYFADVKVALGNDASTLEDKLMLLPEFLPALEGKNGILQMQAYDSESGKYAFKPEG